MLTTGFAACGGGDSSDTTATATTEDHGSAQGGKGSGDDTGGPQKGPEGFVRQRGGPRSGNGGIASLRVEGDRGFALYHGAKDVGYFVPMVKEEGEWKVGALAPSDFP